jgi:[protein-PII] uridylyltransferase
MSLSLAAAPPASTNPPQTGLLDLPTLAADLDLLADQYAGRERELRSAIAGRLKSAVNAGRLAAEDILKRDRHGRRCAERLSAMTDDVIRLIHTVITRRVYPADNPSDAERVAIVATGGYGRGLMAPGSDIDLLFLLPWKQTAWGEQVAEAMLYCLWDMGLKVGHATRSVDECLRQAKADMTVRTALLESRFLLGNRALFSELVSRFDREVVAGTGNDFVAAKLAERDTRHRRSGQSRYLVEPNVKDGKGGLRDLHTLFWIAKYIHNVRDPHDLVTKGVFDRAEYQIFRRAEDFLWSVRCHLHFVTGRAEERLSFDVQREIGLRLGYVTHPGMKDVERFMKHYFLVAKDVGDLTRILCADLEERQAKPAAVLSRLVARLKPSTRKSIPGTTDFVSDHGRIAAADPDVFRRDPVNLIRIFHLAEKHNLAFNPDTLRIITRSLKLIDDTVRASPVANGLFRDLLCSRRDPETILRKMNEAGVLGRFVPEFGRIVAMMQFNMYHHYTVDEHLLRCIGVLGDIERASQPELGLANDLFRSIHPGHRDLLYVAMLLHDIAKGQPEDHSVAGARIARKLGPRFGLSQAETELVAWLVQEHLTMSSIAQSRDLSDRKTIEDFAKVVQSLERLKLLTILTTADIRAVGPGVWNGWKAQLLRTLYYETEPVVTGGFSEVNRSRRVELAQAELRANLKDWPEPERDLYIARHYPAYWLKADLAHKIAHARFLKRIGDEGRTLATDVALDAARGVTEITVVSPDHPRLLSTIAGICAAAGANIVDAQIFTTTDGRALDTIAITRALDRDEDEERRARRIAENIERALSGNAPSPDAAIRREPARGRHRTFAVEPEVAINNQWSNRQTVIEVSGLDRPGLLHDLTATLSRLNLNITSAHIATFGERAVDVFYVTDLTGAKIDNPTRQAAIRRALVSVFAPPG